MSGTVLSDLSGIVKARSGTVLLIVKTLIEDWARKSGDLRENDGQVKSAIGR